MLRISRKGDYALLLLSSLSRRGVGVVVSLKEISKERRMPYAFLSQIAPILVEHGFLGSKEGVGGGYFLRRDPATIQVGEVLELLEGPIAPVECLREGCVCEEGCLQKSVMERMAEALRKSMRGFTLADLVGK